MDEFDRFDLQLYGIWTDIRSYGDNVSGTGDAGLQPEGGLPGDLRDGTLAEEARRVLLETKSAEGALDATEELRRLLNEMTVEMRDQFTTFRRLRAAAEQALQDGDEAAQKLARADVKAATDAMSLIVRTLEKVDALQRQLARDRIAAAEQSADREGYEEAKARFLKMIEERAGETAFCLFEAWKRDGPPEWVTERLERAAPEPSDAKAGAGEDCGQGLERGLAAEPGHGEDHGDA